MELSFPHGGQGEGSLQVYYLRRVGIAWSVRSTREEVRGEYEQVWRQLGDRPIEALPDLARMLDPVACAIIDVLTAGVPLRPLLRSPVWGIAAGPGLYDSVPGLERAADAGALAKIGWQ